MFLVIFQNSLFWKEERQSEQREAPKIKIGVAKGAREMHWGNRMSKSYQVAQVQLNLTPLWLFLGLLSHILGLRMKFMATGG